MIGQIYNNPQLSYEGDGFTSFDEKNPHDYWCVIKVNEEDVLIAPVFFCYADELSNNVLESFIYQIDDANPIVIVIGHCVWRKQDELGDPVIYLNPVNAKKAWKAFRSTFLK